jgi:hypothetical protein
MGVRKGRVSLKKKAVCDWLEIFPSGRGLAMYDFAWDISQ